MKAKGWIWWLFVLAALYDGILGLLFLAAPGDVFERFQVAPPNHFGYVQFSAALLLIFAWMFAAVAMAPQRNRNLIPYGMGLKAAYCSLVFYYWFTIQIPTMWKPFAVADLAFLVLFLLAYVQLGKR
jgi:hypothetical protein